MPDRLKDSYGRDVPQRVADLIAAVDPSFDGDAFVAWVLGDYDDLELLPRARRMADGLARYLPDDPERAIDTLLASLPTIGQARAWRGMQGFVLMPYVVFVGQHGLDCFEAAMRLQHEITQRFTAEFSIREFIAHHYEPTMQRLAQWVHDDSEHVRRLVSEGTRPRLPWAPRLQRFIADPTPILPFLEELKDDPSAYVRRSVANNLNDIGKDHPDVLLTVARRWMKGASPERRALVRHALRSRVKAGDPGALAVLGFAGDAPIRLLACTIEPAAPKIGERVRVTITVISDAATPVRGAVDLAVDFVKAGGRTGHKVFKGAELELAPGEPATLTRSVSVAQHTTRTHYPGEHRVRVLINGVSHDAGAFDLVAAAP